MKDKELKKLRKIITESLRVQKNCPNQVGYIDSSNALVDAVAKQNHVIFGRRGCGKTLLLFESTKLINNEQGNLIVYINCEDYKNHSFPNVLIEILDVIFDKLGSNIGVFALIGRKRKARKIIVDIKRDLDGLRKKADEQSEAIREKLSTEKSDLLKAGIKSSVSDVGVSASDSTKREVERTYNRFDSKIDNLNHLLPKLKKDLSTFFQLIKKIKFVFIQLDDFYHLHREIQPYVMDYMHRLCKDLPLYFKVATLKHVSTLFVERSGQPIGAQERHDYQPIHIDFTFQDFGKTENQIKRIFYKYGEMAGCGEELINSCFKGDGFRRLVLAGGGVPRDCLSLFITAFDNSNEDYRIGKDEVRLLSLSNLERRIQELTNDSQREEQDSLLRSIYTIRKFCIDKKNNIFLISERLMQENENIKKLIYRLLDYRIIHNVGSAFTHKSQSGDTYNAFMIDIGCYANLRKLYGKMNEIDLSSRDAKEQIRSLPIISQEEFDTIWESAPNNLMEEILSKDNDNSI